MNSPIGIFDSGLGHLSVLSHCLKNLQGRTFLALSDNVSGTFGDHNLHFVTKRTHQALSWFESMGTSSVIIACNTATAVAIESARAKFPHMNIVGIEPMIKNWENLASNREGQVAVLLTELLAKSERFSKLRERFDPGHKLLICPCPHLASLIETGTKDQEALKKELIPLEGKKIAGVILGCTHYPLIKDELEKILKAPCYDPSLPVALRVQEQENSYDGVKAELKIYWTSQDSLYGERALSLLDQIIDFRSKYKVTLHQGIDLVGEKSHLHIPIPHA